MVVEKRSPGLGWRASSSVHVTSHRGLGDLDAELGEFRLDPGCTPGVVRSAEFADEDAGLLGHGRPAWDSGTALPGPEQTKSSTVPAEHSFWLYQVKRSTPFWPDSGEGHPEEPVRIREPRTTGFGLQAGEHRR